MYGDPGRRPRDERLEVDNPIVVHKGKGREGLAQTVEYVSDPVTKRDWVSGVGDCRDSVHHVHCVIVESLHTLVHGQLSASIRCVWVP
jgi:hypothetical protein